jgi:hypothetical protein
MELGCRRSRSQRSGHTLCRIHGRLARAGDVNGRVSMWEYHTDAFVLANLKAPGLPRTATRGHVPAKAPDRLVGGHPKSEDGRHCVLSRASLECPVRCGPRSSRTNRAGRSLPQPGRPIGRAWPSPAPTQRDRHADGFVKAAWPDTALVKTGFRCRRRPGRTIGSAPGWEGCVGGAHRVQSAGVDGRCPRGHRSGRTCRPECIFGYV